MLVHCLDAPLLLAVLLIEFLHVVVHLDRLPPEFRQLADPVAVRLDLALPALVRTASLIHIGRVLSEVLHLELHIVAVGLPIDSGFPGT